MKSRNDWWPALLAVGVLLACGPAVAQNGPPPMPAGATEAEKSDAVSKLNGQIQGYTPTPPPAGLAPLGGKQDANATKLLQQLKAKGIAVKMIDLFIKYGGTLNLVISTKAVAVGDAPAAAKYDVDTMTITVPAGAGDGAGGLRTNLSITNLGGLAHEFWHAYKAQIVDKGFDPDTAKAFTDLKAWLVTQKVTYMEGGQTPSGTMTFLKANPGWNRYTEPGYTDDFADEYVAGMITDLFSYGPYLGGDHPLDSLYGFLRNFGTGVRIGYFNSNNKNYRVDAPPPPELVLQLYRLAMTSLTPKVVPPEPAEETPGHGMAPSAPGGPNAPQYAGLPTPLESAVLDQINFARTRPQDYAKTLHGPAAGEAVAFLQRQTPLMPLVLDPRLTTVAQAHALDEGSHGLTSHVGTDGSTPAKRMQHAGMWSTMYAEEISLGEGAAAGVVRQLIIDATTPSRAHRIDLFGTLFAFAGVGCGPHTTLHSICVIDMTAMLMR
jgi:uncharacterized protein YkwD